MSEKLERALQLIDGANRGDPDWEMVEGQGVPKALLYGWRMTEWLHRLDPEPSEALQLAARGQHIRRWEIPRGSYPPTREGYLSWRTKLYRFHAEQIGNILNEVGYDEPTIEHVARIVAKRGLKQDQDVQRIEDVACLVFLSHDFAQFATAHPREKLIDIVRKTWRKMSEIGRAEALRLPLADSLAVVVKEALES
jgi:hypothetical protein